MAQIPGTIGITGAVAPVDSTDKYPTHFAKFGKGGYYAVQNINERDNIPSERKEEGLLVYVLQENKPYIWKNNTWSFFISSLQPATDTLLGGVKKGSGVSIDEEGTISSFKYTNRIYVSPQGLDTNDGRSPETALKTIKAAARLATTTTEVESIYVGTGEFIEDNPIYLPPGTAVIGDNLRRTIVKPLNEGRDFFWWSSGCYVNYLVFQDYYFGGVGKLDTSNQPNDRELSAVATTFKLFPGHTLKRLPGVYKDGAGLISFQKEGIVNATYTYLTTSENGGAGHTIPSAKVQTCKRDIGFFVDAIYQDLKAGGNVNSINCGKAYRDANRDLITSMITSEVLITKQAFTKAKDLCKTAILTVPNEYPVTVDTSNANACADVSTTIENLHQLIISLIDGGDVPEYNSGSNYILIDQECMEVFDLDETNNTVTVKTRGVPSPRPNNSIPNPSAPLFSYDTSIAAKHINGAVVSQAGRSFRYAVAFPDQSGYWGKGRITISSTPTGTLSSVYIVTGLNTSFLKEAFVGWSLKVGNNSYTIKTINSDTSITVTNAPVGSVAGKAYKIVPAKEQIFLSPYIQNCSNISVLGKAHYDAVTQSYDADKTRAGGMLVDNNQLDSKSPIPSNVADAFTQIAFGGIGFHHKNDAYSQLVSVFQVFDGVGILCESGSYTSVTNSATNFGDLGLVALGYSTKALPSFKDGVVTYIENVASPIFNGTETPILSSRITSESGGAKTKATITVNANDIIKFLSGQTITIAAHTSSPNINVTGQRITAVNLTNNTIEVILDTAYSGLPVIGGNTGTINITAGQLETKITVSGFKENPPANYIVIIQGLPQNADGTEYVVKEVTSSLNSNNCIFTLEQVIPSNLLSGINNSNPNKKIELRAPSVVNSSGHTFEYVGSGLNYTALPINGGQTNRNNQTVEINSGKCYVSSTDQDGDFSVGSYFNVNLRTGKVKFAGQLNLGVVDSLELKQSPGNSITQFVTSIGDSTSTKNTALPTEKAVRDFITNPNNLGQLIGKTPTTAGGTNLYANQLVQLDGDGFISSSMVKFPVAKAYSVSNQQARLDLPNLKAGDIVFQQDNNRKYILNTTPSNILENWGLWSVDTFSAFAIVSDVISPERLGTGTTNENYFLNGSNQWKPVVTKLKAVDNLVVSIGEIGGTAGLGDNTNGRSGALEINVTKAAFGASQTTGSSTIGVAAFNIQDFGIDLNSVVSVKNKLKEAQLPLVFDNTNGRLTIETASASQSGALSVADWTKFNNTYTLFPSVSQAKANLGINQVNNTSDLDKPVSKATQDAILAYSIALG